MWQQLNSGHIFNKVYLKEREQTTSQNIAAPLTLLHKELHRCWGTALHAHRSTELQCREVTRTLCSTLKSFFSQHKTQDTQHQSTLPGVLRAEGCVTARLMVRAQLLSWSLMELSRCDMYCAEFAYVQLLIKKQQSTFKLTFSSVFLIVSQK